MSAPILSVIMPVYNAEKYVHEAIDGILKQSFTDFEFLIYNDCSTDSSREIILSFQDPRIQLFDSPVNTGYVKHLNDGLKQAKGKYIARMDADDVSLHQRFEKQVEFLEQHEEVGVCGSWIEFIGYKEGIVNYPADHIDIITHFFLFGNAVAHPAAMMRRSVLESLHLSYNRSLEPAEDYDLWSRMSLVTQLHNIPEVLVQYRVHDNNESIVKKIKQDKAVAFIREEIIARHVHHHSATIKAFIFNQPQAKNLGSKELTELTAYVKTVLASGGYNNRWVKITLTNRFVAWCKYAKLSGFTKMRHYLAFPSPFFSVRICLSLLMNRQ
ncbi:MAG: glycosyltransferase [Chitinophagaceae bacterium]|nr:glycosyltransferase [Chitinophagaceae bacterium]